MWLILILVIILLTVLFFTKCDGDLTLMFYEHFFGHKLKDLKDQVVWITGASSGIGAGCALDFAGFGAKLVLSARSVDKLQDVKQRCLKNSGLRDEDILVLEMDMTDLDSHLDMFNKVVDHFGRLDVLINNAGRTQRAKWEDIDIQVDRDMFELNVFSVVNLSRIYVKHLIRHNSK